jgi:alpha-glucosidase
LTGPATGAGAPGQPPSALDSVHHDGSARYVRRADNRPALGLRLGDEVAIRLRAGLDAPVERVFLRTTPDGEQRFAELAEAVAGPACRWWEATIRLEMPVTLYRFLLLVDGEPWWCNGSGLHRGTPTDHEDFRLVAGLETPAWLRDRVFYQIFPDRFENGDPGNDVADGAWTYRGHTARHRAWGEPPRHDPSAIVDFYGGDLAGVEARLDHLLDLGVNAIYLNPVFASRSYHGYDTIDFDHVAAHLGGDAALASLRRATRERGIRLVLDIVPNHTGAEHPWFTAARRDPSAPTAGYYLFRQRPDDYESWLGFGNLPKLDYGDPGLRTAMYGPDGVMRRWLRPPFAIDGWRVDVANMLGRLGAHQLGHEVARGMRDAVKAENPDAYLFGEHSYDATDQLAGDEWDGVMNYAGFADPVSRWLAGGQYWAPHGQVIVRTGPSSTADMVATLAAFRAPIPWALAACQYNLLGSHDQARIRSVVRGDLGRLRAGLGLLLTYVGAPAILYGDEVGLEGADSTAARRTMPWERDAWDIDLLADVRALVRLRTRSSALGSGGFQVLEVGEDCVAWLRDTDEEQVIVVAVRGPEARPSAPLPVAHGAVGDGTEFVELLTGARRRVSGGHLPVPATRPGVAVWQSVPPADGAA